MAEELNPAEEAENTVPTNEGTENTEATASESVEEEVVPQPPKKFVRYTSNDVLNQILNETKGGVPREGQYVGLSEGFSNIGGDNSIINEAVAPVKAPERFAPDGHT